MKKISLPVSFDDERGKITDLLGIDPRTLFEEPTQVPKRMTCPVCGQVFSRRVGYRIHLALKAKDDPEHAQLNPHAAAVAQPAPAQTAN